MLVQQPVTTGICPDCSTHESDLCPTCHRAVGCQAGGTGHSCLTAA